jgi:tRNA-dihydrouridine synthase B
MRTGWDPTTRNAVRIAHIAEDSGVVALALHGRTRACRFEGEAEHRTIAEVKQQVKIPLYANGDIDSAEKAWQVLRASGADGVMIGRAAQGRPWIFREIEARLAGDAAPPAPRAIEVGAIMRAHLRDLYAFYGEAAGVRIARKHIGWYCRDHAGAGGFRQSVMQALSASAQLELVQAYFDALDETTAAAA